jgi:hypothetical protein
MNLMEKHTDNANSNDMHVNIKEAALKLCRNRYANNTDLEFENKIIHNIKSGNNLDVLSNEVLLLPNGKDGDIRVGAAKISGDITPSSISKKVIKEVEKHLDDNLIRDYMYAGFQCDEEDIRSVSECAKLSIEKLTQNN